MGDPMPAFNGPVLGDGYSRSNMMKKERRGYAIKPLASYNSCGIKTLPRLSYLLSITSKMELP